MGQLYSNNAASILTIAIGPSDTAIAIRPQDADEFPVAVDPDYFKVTLEDADGNIEIIKVTSRAAGSSSFYSVVRGQEGTSPIAFDAGSIVECRLTAEDIQYAIAHPSSDPSHAASTVSVDLIEGLDSDNVQDALEEINTDLVEAIALQSTTFVHRAGDTMTGPLILDADPTSARGAATKQYVDNQIAAIPDGGGTGGGGTTIVNVEEIKWDNKVVDNQSLSSYDLTSTSGAGLYKVHAQVTLGTPNWVGGTKVVDLYFMCLTPNESISKALTISSGVSVVVGGMPNISNASAKYVDSVTSLPDNITGISLTWEKQFEVGQGNFSWVTQLEAAVIKNVWKIW